MKNEATTAAAAYLGPKILRGFRLRWLIYGAAAYYGLRFMSKRGIFPKQADAALDVIDKGIGTVKEQFGFGSSMPSPDQVAAKVENQLTH